MENEFNNQNNENVNEESQVENAGSNENAAASEPEVDYRKSFESTTRELSELKKVLGRQAQEVGDLRKFKEQMSPMQANFERYQKAEQAKLFQDNPVEALKQYFAQTIKQEISPLQEYYQSQQSEVVAVKAQSELQQKLGTEFDNYRTVMADILKFYRDSDVQNGTSFSKDLMNNSDMLIQLAEVALNKQSKQVKTQNSEIAQNQAKRMSGAITKSGASPAPTSDLTGKSSKEIRDLLMKKGAWKTNSN